MNTLITGREARARGDRTGIEKGNLSRLENVANPNPTFDTLTRYADLKELLT
jgi:hypothetical protein